MVNFTTLTLEQVRNYKRFDMPHLPIEQLARQARDEYQVRIIIPNWDNHGNQQQYVKQADGTWIDCYNEVYRSEEFVMERVAEHNLPNTGI